MVNAISQVEDIKGSLVLMKPQFELALPKHIEADKFVKVAETAIMNKPDLLNLDRNSLFLAFTQAAQEGLLPDGREAAIVPFKGKAKLMPMVAGVCKKARNSGEISTIDSQVVYENDQYESWVDEKGPHFKHKRATSQRGKVLLTYAYAIGKDGGVFFEEIDEEQMAAIEKKSQAGADSPWRGDFKDEMRRKSALRRLCKYRLPNSSDLDMTFKKDDEFYEEDEPAKDVTPQTTPKVLAATLEAQKPGPTVEQAVVMAKQVFPEAKVVAQKAAPKAPVKSPPEAKGVTVSGLEISGEIQTMSAKPATNGNMRHSVKVNNIWLGTFDEAIAKKMAEAADGKYQVKIRYDQKRNAKDQQYNDITALEIVGLTNEGEIPL